MSDAPWSEDAENVVLGYLMIAGTISHECFVKIKDMFCSADFYGPGNSEIYNAICALSQFGNVSPANVSNFIRCNNKNFIERYHNDLKGERTIEGVIGVMVGYFFARGCIQAYADIVKARADLRHGRNVVKFVKKDNEEKK